jgi:thiamine-phosphate pyrophosphorylase
MSERQAGHHCQIYLGLAGLPADRAQDMFEQTLRTGRVACSLLGAAAMARFGEALSRALIDLAHRNGVPVLVENDAGLAKSLGVDGVHLDGRRTTQNAVLEARALVGAEAIVGAEAGLSRHAAMVSGEYGADYISFGDPSHQRHHEIGQIADMVRWWAELFEVSCVAWHRGGLDEAKLLADSGADFLAVDDFVWNGGGEPARALEALDCALKS